MTVIDGWTVEKKLLQNVKAENQVKTIKCFNDVQFFVVLQFNFVNNNFRQKSFSIQFGTCEKTNLTAMMTP